MAGPAPTEIQYTDQHEADLYNKTAPNVEQATGQPTTPESLKPEDETPLDKAKEGVEDFFRYYGSNVIEQVSGKATDADVMTSRGDEAITIARKKGFLSRIGLKKAA